jgi:hypothetical protein
MSTIDPHISILPTLERLANLYFFAILDRKVPLKIRLRGLAETDLVDYPEE